jgi:uncharacterized protein YuzE
MYYIPDLDTLCIDVDPNPKTYHYTIDIGGIDDVSVDLDKKGSPLGFTVTKASGKYSKEFLDRHNWSIPTKTVEEAVVELGEEAREIFAGRELVSIEEIAQALKHKQGWRKVSFDKLKPSDPISP